MACAIDVRGDHPNVVDDRVFGYRRQIEVITTNDMLYVMENLR